MINDILETIAKDYSMTVDQMKARDRRSEYLRFRFVGMAVLKLQGCTNNHIGRVFNDRDHSTIISNLKNIDNITFSGIEEEVRYYFNKAKYNMEYPKSKSTISAKTYREEYLNNSRTKKKYHNQSQIYNGRRYDSKLEANFAEELDWRKEAGEVKEVIPQYKIALRGLLGGHITNYFIDFKVINSDDSITYFECKGMKLPLWILKWNLTIQQMAIDEPGSELIIIK